MTMKKKLSLIMNEPAFNEGVVYQFKPVGEGLDKFRLWDIDGESGMGFYLVSDYPTDDVMDDVKDINAGEDWFDEAEMDCSLAQGYDVYPVQIWAENNYKLPYQEITLEDGRIMAHDTETGIDRELARVRVMYKGEDRFSFFILVRGNGGDMNFSSVCRILNLADSKTPAYMKRCWQGLLNEVSKNNGTIRDIKIITEDMYVLSTV